MVNKIIYLGSGYRPLEYLANDSDVELTGVFVRPNPLKVDNKATYPFVNYIEDLCITRNIPLYQPQKLDKDTVSIIVDSKPDFLVCCGYHLLLPPEIIKSSKYPAINLHPGKLPEYRGQSVIEWAMFNGEREMYMTMHLLTEKFDEGDILMEKSIQVSTSDNGNTAQGKLYTAAAAMIKEFISDPARYMSSARKQSSDGNYYHRLKKTDHMLNWSGDMHRARNIVRTMVYPRDGAYTFIDGEKIIVDGLKELDRPSPSNSIPGTIIDHQNNTYYLSTAENIHTIDAQDIRNYFIVHDKLQIGKVMR